jgi:protein-disulfide isomerase
MDKRFWGILAVIAVLLIGVFVVTNHKKASAPSTAGTLTSHIEGKGSSGVTLTEYGDYQCPACGQYYPLVKQVQQTYQDQIFFQFRNFPLYQIHPNAIAGARAAEAADMQGKYWEMHDLLYENQQVWSTGSNPLSDFDGYAKQLGLNVTKFDADFKSNTANDRIQADLAKGNQLGIDSTPTFFIDGKKISNPTSIDAFNKVIDTAIQQKTGKAPTATAAPSSANTTVTDTATPANP